MEFFSIVWSDKLNHMSIIILACPSPKIAAPILITLRNLPYPNFSRLGKFFSVFRCFSTSAVAGHVTRRKMAGILTKLAENDDFVLLIEHC